MAKHVILEAYTFTPSTKTIMVTGKWIRREQLMLITNTTKGIVLYNFSDPTLGATITNAFYSNNEVTNIVLAYDTTAHSSTDKIAIIVEETYENILPAEALIDPVGKMRVSTPQSLIDTDFEYGQQPTKWETIVTVNNKPTAFYDPSSAGFQFPHTVGTAYQANASSLTAVVKTGTATFTANATANTIAVLSALVNVTDIVVGMPVKIHGTGAPGTLGQNATVISIDNTTQVTIQTTTPNISGTALNVITATFGGITSNANSFTAYHVNTTTHPVGSFVQILGSNPSYNGQWQVGASGAGFFTVYTSANPGYHMTSGGTGATFTLTASGGVISAGAVSAAGSGYRIGEKILVTGGGGTGAYFTVATLSGTGVATVTVASGDGGFNYTNGAVAATAANGSTFGTTATVTGVNTVFHTGMIGSRIIFGDGTDSGEITAVASTTSLTASVRNLVSSTTGVPYTIYGFVYLNAGTPNVREAQTSLSYLTGDNVTQPAAQAIAYFYINTGGGSLSVGQPLFITGSNDQANVDGWWVITAISINNNATGDIIYVKLLNAPTATALFDPTKTQIFPGSWYTQSSIQITSLTAAGEVVTVACPTPHGLTLGQHIHVVGTSNATYPNAYNGTFIVQSVSAVNSFTFRAPGGPTTGALTINGGSLNTIYSRAQGYVIHRPYDGGVQFANQNPYHGLVLARQTRRYFRYQSGKGIQFSTGSILKPAIIIDRITNTSGGTTATVYCKTPHGLTANTSAKVTNPTVKISNAIDYQATSFAGTAAQSGTAVQGYRTNFSANMVGQQFYFADGTYAGIISAVTLATQQLTVSNTLTVSTLQKYTVQSPTYNGTFTVATTPNAYTFTYTMPQVNPNTGSLLAYNMPGTPGIVASPMTWYGGKNRLGLFDAQNGFFFEFDGVTLWAVRRSSTMQIGGTVSVTRYSQTVTGNNTLFSDQLKPGDHIVIRGYTYTVNTITSDTAMTIYPEYRGATPLSTGSTTSNVLPTTLSSGLTQQYGIQVSKVVETRVRQSEWNIDKLDGTGASGYNIDLTRMQMFYIDYSWYGAGAVRFGIKNNRGEVIYCHRMMNNNQNTEAYMRSGNIPARYETNTIAPATYVTNTNSIISGTTTTGLFYAGDITGFPPKGIISVSAAGTSGAVEFMAYDNSAFTTTQTGFNVTSRGLQADTATIVTGSAGGGAAGTAFTYSATAPIKVELFAPSLASTISHWGSSVIMDGRYDDDKSLVFSSGMNNPLVVSQRQQYPLISIRIAPSVDSGSIGAAGSRELINRMQLLLRQMDAQTNGASFAVDLWLNAAVASGSAIGCTGTTAGGTTLNLTSTYYPFTGTAPTVGTFVYGPAIPAGTFFSAYSSATVNTLSYTPTQTLANQTYWFSSGQYSAVGGSSLAQRYLHPSTDRLIPGTGEKIFTFFTNSTGVTQQDLTFVRDLANSILGGASTNHVPNGPTQKYPDGPDTLTMVATPIGSINSASIIARLSWTEAQA
jgi:hypothetical protein